MEIVFSPACQLFADVMEFFFWKLLLEHIKLINGALCSWTLRKVLIVGRGWDSEYKNKSFFQLLYVNIVAADFPRAFPFTQLQQGWTFSLSELLECEKQTGKSHRKSNQLHGWNFSQSKIKSESLKVGEFSTRKFSDDFNQNNMTKCGAHKHK